MKVPIKSFVCLFLAVSILTALCACRAPVESVRFKEKYIEGNKLYICYTVCYELKSSEFFLVFKNESKKLNGSLSTTIKSDNTRKGDYKETFDLSELEFKSASKNAQLDGEAIKRTDKKHITDKDVRIMLGNSVKAYIEAYNDVIDKERFEVDIK